MVDNNLSQDWDVEIEILMPRQCTHLKLPSMHCCGYPFCDVTGVISDLWVKCWGVLEE